MGGVTWGHAIWDVCAVVGAVSIVATLLMLLCFELFALAELD